MLEKFENVPLQVVHVVVCGLVGNCPKLCLKCLSLDAMNMYFWSHSDLSKQA